MEETWHNRTISVCMMLFRCIRCFYLAVIPVWRPNVRPHVQYVHGVDVIFVVYYSHGNFHHEQKKFFSLFFSPFDNLVQHRSVQYCTELYTSAKCVRDSANTVKYMRSGGLLYTVYSIICQPWTVLCCAVMFHCGQVRELQSQFPAAKEISYCLWARSLQIGSSVSLN